MTAPVSSTRLILLGGAVVRADGAPLGGPAAHRHRLALLAMLAVSPTPVSRDKLIAYLWPERDAESGRNLLKVAVHELRKLFGENVLRSTGDQLSYDASALPCDAVDLEVAAASGAHAKVVELYGGPFLDGFYMKDAPEFERWVDGQRQRLAQVYEGALEQLAQAAERAGDWRGAVERWRQLASCDPLRADVALRLMRALDAAGDRAAAIKHADIHALLRQRDFGVEPDGAVASFARELASRRSPPGGHGGAGGAIGGSRGGDVPATDATGRDVPATDATGRDVPATDATDRAVTLPGGATAGADRGREVFTRRTLSRRTAVGAAIAVAATIGIVLVVGTMVNREQSTPTRSPDALAVVPFRVVGADPSLDYLRDGMMDMLVARIGDDGPLRARQARATPAASEADQLPIAIQQGRAAGAGKVLVGDIVAGGGRGYFDVTATIYDVNDRAVVGRATRTISAASSIPATADTLAAELMARFAGEPADRLPDLTRRPLPALRLYLAAQVAYRHGGYQRAESLFARALDVDPHFTLAGLGLALANSWTTINDHYGLGRDVALRGLAGLGARDRLFVAAFFGPDPALGEPRPAPVYLQAWEDVVHKHPDFAEAWYHVGDRYYHFGGLSGLADPVDQARTAFRRALAIDPTLVAPLHHLIEIYAARGEADEARAAAERYFASDPGVARDASAIGWTVAVVTRDERELTRLRANLGQMPLSDLSRIAWITQANGWPTADADSALAVLTRRASATFERSTAATVGYTFALNAGRHAAARAAAASFEAQLPDQPIRALWNVYGVLFGEADTVGLAADLRELEAFGAAAPSGNPDRRSRQVQARCLVGLVRADAQDLARARAEVVAVRRAAAAEPAGSVQRREAEMCAVMLGAAVAVEARSPDVGLRLAQLDTMVLRDRVPPRISLAAAAVLAARLHEQQGDLKAALAASRWREHFTGDPTFLSTQLRIEGDLAARLGDRAAAMRAYNRYLALRPNPDAGSAQAATAAVRRLLSDLERK